MVFPRFVKINFYLPSLYPHSGSNENGCLSAAARYDKEVSAYSYSTTVAHWSRNSRSSGLPLTDWEAATMGSHLKI